MPSLYRSVASIDGTESPKSDTNDAVQRQQQDDESYSSIRLAQRLIYVSHFFSQFAMSAWSFAVILFLAALNTESILLVSTYYLITYASVSFFGGACGAFIDATDRLVAAQACIFVQNASVIIATIACCWLLLKKEAREEDDNQFPKDIVSIALIVAVHIFGSVAQVLDQAFVVAIERDWIVVLSQQVRGGMAASESWLSSTNVMLRQVDLSCHIVAPAVAGIVVGEAEHTNGWCDLHGAALLVGCMNVTALLVEYFCTARVYRLVPALAAPQRTTSQVCVDTTEGDEDKLDCLEMTNTPRNDDGINNKTLSQENGPFRHAFHVYLEQKVLWAGLSLAVLYINSMSFGGIMTAYLLWKGMSAEEMGLWRSIASFTGLLGTFAFQISTKYTTVVNTGELSAVYLFACLTLAVLSFWIPNEKVSMYLFVVSCAASRIGLWTFDITTTLLYQEFVSDGVRGLVGGSQQALNSFFVVPTGVMGLVFRRPDQFFVFVGTSYTGIGLCMLLYTFGIFRRGNQFRMAIDDEQH